MSVLIFEEVILTITELLSHTVSNHIGTGLTLIKLTYWLLKMFRCIELLIVY